MDSFEDNNWDLIDYSSFIDDVAPADLYWTNQRANVQINASLIAGTSQEKECVREECPRKRFSELCSILEPGKPAKIDKLAILGDAMRVLNQLRTESQDYKETNEMLLEEMKTLKAEKNELRAEKLILKADKKRMEQQLEAMTIPPAGFMPAHQATYHTGTNKISVFPGYSFAPMWQYLPPSACDTSQDHELRPPAA
ncbi:unnamed protein product [Ilex paraguariensis]|uniref:BHLH transcription factor n=1 Tax=Ilex paraguariensis TaxID=185542 RepID=A0ABC8ST64_9AQUA